MLFKTNLIRYYFLNVINGALLITISLFFVMLFIFSFDFSKNTIMDVNSKTVKINEKYEVIDCNSYKECSDIFLSNSISNLKYTYDYLIDILMTGSFSVWIIGMVFVILFHRFRIRNL
jgi:hypothetical protein